ncbi:MAG: hypothetical protein AAFO07_00045 [Bacteroidota bacterium]
MGKKLFENLGHLDTKQLKRFQSFVDSPYFNKHNKVRRLMEYVLPFHPSYDDKALQQDTIFTHLFPEEKFQQNKLAVIFTYTQRLYRQFVSLERMQSRPMELELGWLEELRHQMEFDQYEKQYDKIFSQLKKEEKEATLFYHQRYRLSADRAMLSLQKGRREEDQSLQSKQNFLDAFFLAEKFRDACELHLRGKEMKEEFKLRLIDAAIEEMESQTKIYQPFPFVMMYYNIYIMLTNNDNPDYYYQAFDLLKSQVHYFSENELKTLYNYLQNYCIEKINSGRADFLKEIFLLYKSQLENELLIEEGYLSEWHYKNIVTTGIRLKEIDWVEDFIESYKDKMKPDSIDNAYRFNRAAFCHATQRYDEVLSLLHQVEYSDLRYNLGAKALLLRTYYELEELDALSALTDSFRQYLLRNKLMADTHRRGYYNLFRLTKKMATLRVNQSYYSDKRKQKEIEQLRRAIDNTTYIFNKSWLEQKYGELMEEVIV